RRGLSTTSKVNTSPASDDSYRTNAGRHHGGRANDSTCIRNALFILNVTVSLQECPAPMGGGGAGHGRQSPVIYSPWLHFQERLLNHYGGGNSCSPASRWGCATACWAAHPRRSQQLQGHGNCPPPARRHHDGATRWLREVRSSQLGRG